MASGTNDSAGWGEILSDGRAPRFILICMGVWLMFPNRMLPRMYAATASVWGIATVLGPMLGGAFADAGVWPWVFWFFAVQGVAVGAASLWLLPSSEIGDKGARIAWLQLALVTVGVGLIGAADVAGG